MQSWGIISSWRKIGKHQPFKIDSKSKLMKNYINSDWNLCAVEIGFYKRSNPDVPSYSGPEESSYVRSFHTTFIPRHSWVLWEPKDMRREGVGHSLLHVYEAKWNTFTNRNVEGGGPPKKKEFIPKGDIWSYSWRMSRKRCRNWINKNQECKNIVSFGIIYYPGVI